MLLNHKRIGTWSRFTACHGWKGFLDGRNYQWSLIQNFWRRTWRADNPAEYVQGLFLEEFLCFSPLYMAMAGYGHSQLASQIEAHARYVHKQLAAGSTYTGELAFPKIVWFFPVLQWLCDWCTALTCIFLFLKIIGAVSCGTPVAVKNACMSLHDLIAMYSRLEALQW